MNHKDQLTLRGLDPVVIRQIRDLARRERISLNKAALRLIERGAGVGGRHAADRIGGSLDHLIGTWSERDAREVLDSIASCEQVDGELWT